MFRDNVKNVLIASKDKVESVCINMGEAIKGTQLQIPLHYLIQDFNSERQVAKAVQAKNCSIALIPRITDSEGDYVLHVNHKENTADNTAAHIAIGLHNITLARYSQIEFWLKSKGSQEYPLRISIILHSGLSTVNYQLEQDTNGWHRHVIPLADFEGISDFSFISKMSFVFQSVDRSSREWDVYIDDIYLTREK